LLEFQKVLQDVIEREEREGRNLNSEETSASKRQREQFQQRMDIEDRDIIIQGSQATRLSRKQVSSFLLIKCLCFSTFNSKPPPFFFNKRKKNSFNCSGTWLSEGCFL